MNTQVSMQPVTEDFWTESFLGHEIAIFRHSRGWLVYIDQIMQQNRYFATADDAIVWLRRKVDGREPECRVITFSRRKAARRPATSRLN